jgi:SAM-dependent methyltransferase
MKLDDLPVDFDPIAYLELNPDVKLAGVDPAQPYQLFGIKERRVYKHIAGRPSSFDELLHSDPRTRRSSLSRHTNIWEWIRTNCSQPGLRVLEIGSRSVVSDALWRQVIPQCNYTGFDVLEGNNVTVVGDAHRLSQYFSESSFDLIISFAVFEHLALPWIVCEEISKILAPGGRVVVETHFAFSNHEQPWHFFQFNANGLETLFCKELGYNIIDAGLDTPIVGRFSHENPPVIRGQLIPELYCHASIIAEKSLPYRPELWSGGSFDWRAVGKRIVEESMYPIESDMRYREAKKQG